MGKDSGIKIDKDPLVDEVYDYLTKFDFPLAVFIQRRFKIGISRAEKILKQIEEKRNELK